MPVLSEAIGGPAWVPSSTTASFASTGASPADGVAVAVLSSPDAHAASPPSAARPPMPASNDRRLRPDAA